MAAVFFLAGIKAQCEEGGGRLLLGDNTCGVRGPAAADLVTVYWS